jgi:hypothetical protein
VCVCDVDCNKMHNLVSPPKKLLNFGLFKCGVLHVVTCNGSHTPRGNVVRQTEIHSKKTQRCTADLVKHFLLHLTSLAQRFH